MERDPEGQPRGLFVGLSTLDIIQRVPGVPGPDEKVTASRTDIAAGGPALNAAVVFSALGGHAALVTRVGQGGVSSLIREDIESRGVEIIDLADASFRPAVSTITVDDSTGQRQVVSTDAWGGATEKATASPDDHTGLAGHLGDMGRIDIVHLDGHHPDITVTAARWGAARGLPRVCGITAPLYFTFFLFVLWCLVTAGWLVVDRGAARVAELSGSQPSVVRQD